MRSQWNQNRRSFTLVELLVVIVIIGMLAALITQTVMAALTAAREATIKFEVMSIATALNSYKAEFGEYPPDFTDEDVVERHVRLRWPRIDAVGMNSELLKIKSLTLTPAQALVFWLRGFSKSPTHPWSEIYNNTSGTPVPKPVPLFGFDQSRLVDEATGAPVTTLTAYPVYIPTHGNKSSDGTRVNPYIYFDARTYDTAVYGIPGSVPPPTPLKSPYLSNSALEVYAAPDSFQIIHPGLDGEWGQDTIDTASYPNGAGYLPDDRDNIVSFGKNRTLEDDIP